MYQLPQFGRSHAGGVKSMAYAEGQSLLAVGSGDGVIRTWRYSDSSVEFVDVLQGHSKAVTALHFTPDDSRLISGGSDGQVVEWNVETGQRVWCASVGAKGVRSVKTVGAQIVAADLSGNLWTASAGQPGAVLVNLVRPLSTLVTRDRDQLIAVAGEGDKCAFIKWPSREIWEINVGTTAVTSLAYIGDTDTIAISGWDDGRIELWSISEARRVRSLRFHDQRVGTLAYSRTEGYLLSGCSNGTVAVWASGKEEPLAVASGHSRAVRVVIPGPPGHLLSGTSGGFSSYDDSVKGWRLDDSSSTLSQTLEIRANNTWIKAIVTRSNTMACGVYPDRVLIWQQNGVEVRVLPAHHDSVWTVALNNDGTLVALGAVDYSIHLRDTASGALHSRLCHHKSAIRALHFGNQELLAAGDDKGLVSLWDAKTGQVLASKIHGNKAVRCLAFTGSEHLLHGGNDGRLVEWDWRTGEEQTLLTSQEPIRSVVCSPDDQWVAAAGYDRKLYRWSGRERQAMEPLEGHENWIRSLSIDHTRQFVASGADDNSVRVWNLATGECLSTWYGHEGWVYAVQFLENILVLAAGGSGSRLRFWDFRENSVTACRHIRSDYACVVEV